MAKLTATDQESKSGRDVDNSAFNTQVLRTDLSRLQDASLITPTYREESQDSISYLQGSRFWGATAALAVVLFLVSLEATVVTTCLVAITNDLGGFDKVSWVLSSYLGYVGKGHSK
ncbi:hypothetical protein F5B20DRAFT_579423 [Whalleya microplaca]|nr:hypothetical protein F5B20DRAFT_579423 [Whalleya microplaca]